MEATVLDELTEAVGKLLAVDWAGCDPVALHELVVGLEAQRTRLAVAASDALHEWEHNGRWQRDGSLNAASALGRDTRSDPQLRRRDLRRARFLHLMPHTRAAVLEGRLSLDAVDLMLRYATAARWHLFLEHEELLVAQFARASLFDDCRRLMQYWASLADDLLALHRQRPASSTLYASRSKDSGELRLDGSLSAVDGEIVAAELDRLAKEIKLEDQAAGVQRTPAQRRAAALVRMASRSVNATGVSARPLFQVIIGDLTARRLCELASGIVVHPDDLAPFIDSAVMEAFLFEGSTVVISKSNRRTFTGALRRAIQVRDRRCQHRSGCTTPASESDVDHRWPAARGGTTSQSNGRVECVPHNRLAHLHDDLDEPPEERERQFGYLDELRCRLRRGAMDEPYDEDLYVYSADWREVAAFTSPQGER